MSIGAILGIITAVKDILVMVFKAFGLVRDLQKKSKLLSEEKALALKLKSAETKEEIENAARDTLSGF